MKLGIIGTGVISAACVNGLMKSNAPFEQILVSKRSESISFALAKEYSTVEILDNNQEIIDKSDIVMLAVRPQDAEYALAPLCFTPDKQIISLIATFHHQKLKNLLGNDLTICRAIPLPFVAERVGVTALYPSNEIAEKIFNYLGEVVVAENEEEFDRYAIASSTMGIYFETLSTLSDWIIAQGTPSQNAQKYFAGLFNGLTKTALKNSNLPFDSQISKHCTPGGLNEQAVTVFRENGGHEALKQSLLSIQKRLSNT
ncbi:pyrroline-5-carboxylate reductase [Maribrevibacterium harenarium]|uniref:Pyrroline-5-carboxylate reductase n=1 Tax=Maribrevibacterium harenarium TaxID=2589817 RepID=A0A501WR44_9GAMM|nr:pyrroline-5-carboxylate reductase [Maribrevibacterium harenarium]TPE49461.1 pyrroline-5-carboxylate reductase [Maribrevibacterium harenarium]